MKENAKTTNKENKVRRHPVLDKPILAGILLMLWGMMFSQAFSTALDYLTHNIFGSYTIAAFLAIVALVIHKMWFRGEYKGSISRNWFGDKDLRVAFLSIALFDLVAVVISYARFGVSFTLTMVSLSLAAGCCEEVATRALPVSVMMRDWMDEKHVVFIAAFTSVIFGVIHFGNMAGGAGLMVTIIQVASAIGIGFFFAAVYLRTGNILLTIIFHSLHDLLNFMIPGVTQSDGVMTDLSLNTFDVVTTVVFVVICVAAGIYLLRKSVRPQIVAVWKERWNRSIA